MTNGADCAEVVLVDDDDDLRVATAQLLEVSGHRVRAFATGAAALAAIEPDFAGVVLTDVRMPGMSGTELFAALHERDEDLPVLLMTGHGDVAVAVAAMKAGAWDFLTKPFDPDVLLLAVERAARARTLTLENRQLRTLAEATSADALIGEAPAIRRLRAMIPTLADAALDLVIEGEVGTGRAHLARLIHRAGRRGRHRFVRLDCAALSLTAIERELFARGGALSRGHRGTIFLSRLAAASPDLQHRLVTFADERAVALDTRDPDPVDTRIIASVDAADRDRVLPDLLHRLSGVTLRMPPLAERAEDIPLLLATFVAEAARTHGRPIPPLADQANRMRTRPWPGNVLALRNTAERIVLGLEEQGPAEIQPPDSLTERIDAFERQAIVEAVEACNGEIAAAIALLRLPRKTFYYRVNRLGINLTALRQSNAKAR